MAKTYWINEADTLTIYPARMARRISIIYLIAFTVLNITLFLTDTLTNVSTLLIFEGLIVLLALVLYGSGERKAIFDGDSRQLYTRVFGITTNSIPFDQIATITPYDTMGAISYKVFSKENRHGKGILISCGYSKLTNKNLIAYEEEVLPRINELVFSNRPLHVKSPVFDFQFFKEENGIYKVLFNKTGGLILGILLIALTFVILAYPDFMNDRETYKRLMVTYLPLVLGAVFVNAFFTSVSFDQGNRQIIYSTLGGAIRKTYSFDDFIQFLIVRKSMNFIYTGTEVKAILDIPGQGKTRQLILINFRNTKKIERFIDEANTILGLFDYSPSQINMDDE
ncbi:hypothetical protein HDE69_002178 [Pedobacter cryoconitis]|uniref:Uncharacterized protein n=1 Tax=Pedobacter cryoconitis TaxID=188932 RepID=A0A7W8YSQ9_9SPHI|nr:hypothetical protein [Pedobacter cryoconitis]MBB5621125.1 hypothetical protein [Pedobacter cryoconitis]